MVVNADLRIERQTLLWYLSSHKMNKNRNTTRLPMNHQYTKSRQTSLANPPPLSPSPPPLPTNPVVSPLMMHI
jgi:hypothetical protein